MEDTKAIFPKNYGEPWRHFHDSDMYANDYSDGEESPYLGIGTADAPEPNIICWEDEPSERCIALEKRLVACVNALAGVPDELIAETCRLARLGAAVEQNYKGLGEGEVSRHTLARFGAAVMLAINPSKSEYKRLNVQLERPELT